MEGGNKMQIELTKEWLGCPPGVVKNVSEYQAMQMVNRGVAKYALEDREEKEKYNVKMLSKPVQDKQHKPNKKKWR